MDEARKITALTQRKLRLTFVWLVIGMALLRDRSIREVVRHLDLVLPTRAGRGTVSGAAIAQARDRLGPEPLAALFAQTAAVCGPPPPPPHPCPRPPLSPPPGPPLLA